MNETRLDSNTQEYKELDAEAQRIYSICLKLRKETFAGMADCKRAFEQANGDEEKALEILKRPSCSIQ